jgi:hypothetical protein
MCRFWSIHTEPQQRMTPFSGHSYVNTRLGYHGFTPCVGWGESSNPIGRVKTATDGVHRVHPILRALKSIIIVRCVPNGAWLFSIATSDAEPSNLRSRDVPPPCQTTDI